MPVQRSDAAKPTLVSPPKKGISFESCNKLIIIYSNIFYKFSEKFIKNIYQLTFICIIFASVKVRKQIRRRGDSNAGSQFRLSMVRMIKNTVVASRTLKSNLTNKLLDMMTSDWFLKVLESNKSNID